MSPLPNHAREQILSETLSGLQHVHTFAKQILSKHAMYHQTPVLPSVEDIEISRSSLSQTLDEDGLGLQETTNHLIDIAKGFNAGSLSSHYYGFVTGGVTPAARVAEGLVSLFDQNVQVHLPNETLATDVEHKASSMLAELFDLPNHVDNATSVEWQLRTLTTGATASNILGLISAREHFAHVRESGILQAIGDELNVSKIQVLTTMGHSSLIKAAAIAGFGSRNVIDVAAENGLSFDMSKLRNELKNPRCRSVVVVSCGEVNTGAFATHSSEEMKSLRNICDEFSAWLHVDGAFGMFATLLPNEPQYRLVRSGAEGLSYADSIGGDAHKMLNVPYDCGFFFAKCPGPTYSAFQVGNAPYLTSGVAVGTSAQPWQSPLNVGLENSRRFRALPVYATLKAYGRRGYSEIISRCVDLAREISKWIVQSEAYELLPKGRESTFLADTFMIVLFKARSSALNDILITRINRTRAIYVSATKWDGQTACRIAVSNWQVDVQRDVGHVTDVLQQVHTEWVAETGTTK